MRNLKRLDDEFESDIDQDNQRNEHTQSYKKSLMILPKKRKSAQGSVKTKSLRFVRSTFSIVPVSPVEAD